MRTTADYFYKASRDYTKQSAAGATQPSPDREVRVACDYDLEPRRARHLAKNALAINFQAVLLQQGEALTFGALLSPRE
jgi:hypothetical protein